MRVTGLCLGRGVLGCLLVLGPAGCAQASRAASSLPPRSSAAAATTTHDNVIATRKLSRWLLRAVPMPPGAREWSHSPTAHYRHTSTGIGPSDPRFTRTTWWTVPLSRRAFGAWLVAHAPHGLAAGSDSDGSVESGGVWEQDRDFHAPSTMSHTEGWPTTT